MGDDVVTKASALKKAGLPAVYVVLITLFSTPGFLDWLSKDEEKALQQAKSSESKAWKAAWDAFEAREKTELFAEQARIRIQHLEARIDTQEGNTERLREFIMQMILDNRRAESSRPKPPAIRRASVPRALAASAEEAWIEESEEEACESEEAPVQEMAPMPSLDKMWEEQKGSKKQEFADEWSNR